MPCQKPLYAHFGGLIWHWPGDFYSFLISFLPRHNAAKLSKMTASSEGIGYLMIFAVSAMQMGLVFSGLVVGAMAMVMYERFRYIEKKTTQWVHRSSSNE